MLTGYIIKKGSATSGNHGHAGRPGEVGGSKPADNYDEEQAYVGKDFGHLLGALSSWAHADSGDSNVEALRYAAQNVFGNGLSEAETKRYKRDLYYSTPDDFQAAMKREYEYTQSKLKQDYPDGYVTLYRALHNVYDENRYPMSGNVDVNDAVLSSWSSSKAGADQAIEYWGRSMGYRLLEARIPIADIFVYPGSSYAMRMQGEGEFIVINRSKPVSANVVDYEKYQEHKELLGRVVTKGGFGSGNFDHAGRPGEVGGSAATSEAITPPVDYSHFKLKIHDDRHMREVGAIGKGTNMLGTAFMITTGVDPYILQADVVTGLGHDGIGFDIIDQNMYDLSNGDPSQMKTFEEMSGYTRVKWIIENLDIIRVDQASQETNFETKRIDTKTLQRIQELVFDGKITLSKDVVWEGHVVYPLTGDIISESITLSKEEFMKADKVSYTANNGLQLKEKLIGYVIKKGGEGSGNFDHAGRPGEVVGKLKKTAPKA